MNKFFPDWRRVLNELQRYSASGQIDAGVLVNLSENNLNELYGHLKDKRILPKFVSGLSTILIMTQFVFFVGFTIPFMINLDSSTIPHAVVILGEYQFKSFVADQEINLLAFFTELMGQVKFK